MWASVDRTSVRVRKGNDARLLPAHGIGLGVGSAPRSGRAVPVAHRLPPAAAGAVRVIRTAIRPDIATPEIAATNADLSSALATRRERIAAAVGLRSEVVLIGAGERILIPGSG